MRRMGCFVCLLFASIILSAAAAAGQSHDQNLTLQETLPSISASNIIRFPEPSFILRNSAVPLFDSYGLLEPPRYSDSSNKPQIKRVKRTTIDPSMVGYIDNAVVHSEIRIRFDAALDDQTPDRAEFFYAKCGCYAFLKGSAYDPKTPGPGSSIPKDVNFQQLYFRGEYAPFPSQHFSLTLQLPIRWLQPQGTPQPFPSTGGVADVMVGLKVAVLATPRTDLTLQFNSYMPTGDAGVGLGTHHYSVEPSVLYYQRLSEPLAIEGEFGATHPLGSSSGVPTSSPNGFAGDVLFYGAGPSYRFINDEKFSLSGVVEVVGWNVRGGFVTGRAPGSPGSTAGVNIVNMKVGPRISFKEHNSLYVGYGIALTSQNWYREIFRIEYRYAF